MEGALNNAIIPIKRPSDRADSAGEVSIYEERHLRKHRRRLPLQAGEFRAAEQP